MPAYNQQGQLVIPIEPGITKIKLGNGAGTLEINSNGIGLTAKYIDPTGKSTHAYLQNEGTLTIGRSGQLGVVDTRLSRETGQLTLRKDGTVDYTNLCKYEPKIFSYEPRAPQIKLSPAAQAAGCGR